MTLPSRSPRHETYGIQSGTSAIQGGNILIKYALVFGNRSANMIITFQSPAKCDLRIFIGVSEPSGWTDTWATRFTSVDADSKPLSPSISMYHFLCVNLFGRL